MYGKTRGLNRKKDGSFKNSTGSCWYYPNEKKAGSYNETLFIYDNTIKRWVVNVKSFSVTTSCHYSILSSILPLKGAVYVEVDTLNNYRGLKKLVLNSEADFRTSHLFTKRQLKEAKQKEIDRTIEIKLRNKNNRIRDVLNCRIPVKPETWLKHFSKNPELMRQNLYSPINMPQQLVDYLTGMNRQDVLQVLGIKKQSVNESELLSGLI